MSGHPGNMPPVTSTKVPVMPAAWPEARRRRWRRSRRERGRGGSCAVPRGAPGSPRCPRSGSTAFSFSSLDRHPGRPQPHGTHPARPQLDGEVPHERVGRRVGRPGAAHHRTAVRGAAVEGEDHARPLLGRWARISRRSATAGRRRRTARSRRRTARRRAAAPAPAPAVRQRRSTPPARCRPRYAFCRQAAEQYTGLRPLRPALAERGPPQLAHPSTVTGASRRGFRTAAILRGGPAPGPNPAGPGTARGPR
ncbi:hypothetical protein FB157_104228 [Streptomyces sp. BK340]|nr:hypothetical protein FB157_104228 [Streptomyces sp. BK340]